MIELGELEKNHAEFEMRNVRVVAASVDDQEHAQQTQEQFPHLMIVSDADQKLIDAAQVLHRGANNSGQDVAAPTTFFIDKQGVVRSLFRPAQILTRLSAKEVLQAVDEKLAN